MVLATLYQIMNDLIGYLVENTRPDDEVVLDVIRPNSDGEQISVVLGIRSQPEVVNEGNS